MEEKKKEIERLVFIRIKMIYLWYPQRHGTRQF
jgi:hypothetical protein